MQLFGSIRKALLICIVGGAFLFGQTIDLGSAQVDQFCTGGLPYTIQTPSATGDLTLRYGQFSCTVPTSPGLYTVAIFMRETGTGGQRSFSVRINGQPALTNFDLFAASGLAELQRDFQTVSNGTINIDFTYTLKSAVASRIIVTPAPQSGVFPKQVSETILLSAIPDTQALLLHTLQKTPVPGGQIVVFLKSDFIGRDKVEAVRTAAVNPKQLEFILPGQRPLSGDLILVLYWTLE